MRYGVALGPGQETTEEVALVEPGARPAGCSRGSPLGGHGLA